MNIFMDALIHVSSLLFYEMLKMKRAEKSDFRPFGPDSEFAIFGILLGLNRTGGQVKKIKDPFLQIFDLIFHTGYLLVS